MLDAKEIVTLLLGAIGTVLGVVNTYVQLNTHRVRLKVIPTSVIMGPNGVLSNRNDHFEDGRLAIEVLNLSSFPVTISEIGFTLENGMRLTVREPMMNDSQKLPRRLAQRESFTAYILDFSGFPSNIELAYAKTACGETALGDSKALRAFKSSLN